VNENGCTTAILSDLRRDSSDAIKNVDEKLPLKEK